MRKTYLAILFLSFSLTAAHTVRAQVSDSITYPNIYNTSGGEFIFSFANIDADGESVNNVMRFSAFFHAGQKWHFDFSNHFGLMTGYGLRNIGFITEDDGIRIAAHEGLISLGDDVKIKRRTYALGVPAGFKVGNFNRNAFVYAGMELELFFNYKEKLFINGEKEDKFNEWFSDRTALLNPSVFGGVQLPAGVNLQFKYYFNNFLQQTYTERVSGVDFKPYEGLDTRLFYFSLSFNLNRSKGNPFGRKPPVEERT
ncbi:hypothetical protein [Phaeodactylibacter luteus]|uniref:Outer membrane beta-barrel protein n=1 Tax=Phaeodactylibacter luteus TaxID=1564516 RepID=A0A5C6RRK0_9BACT|nr:hypothetical protein [Phaeodactylibacter luteus]TXB64893.1 hypothetical protein FRY97_06610 [Phaeodactylibacter luteus]